MDRGSGGLGAKLLFPWRFIRSRIELIIFSQSVSALNGSPSTKIYASNGNQNPFPLPSAITSGIEPRKLAYTYCELVTQALKSYTLHTP